VYRSQQPDEATVNDAEMELEEYNTDSSKLVEWPAVHCY